MLAPDYAISSASQDHPWYSWLLYGKTVYYFSPSGMIPVPSFAVFTNNGGSLSRLLPMNKADIAIVKTSVLPVMVSGDGRVK